MKVRIAISFFAFSVILLLAFTGRNQQSSVNPYDAMIESSVGKLLDSMSLEKSRSILAVLYGMDSIHGVTMFYSGEKIDLAPGMAKTVPCIIGTTNLAYSGSDFKWVTEKGEFLMSTENLIKNLHSGEKNVINICIAMFRPSNFLYLP